jgi:hypothetical protein|nr:MAG TPA: hypothetical protein [Caudoviricetes sp.]DAQ62860.1 MAG TPA: hypothetical protein [Caudoviricetes sp.]
MKQKERTEKRKREIDYWFEVVKPKASIEYKEKFRKKNKNQSAPFDCELWFKCFEQELTKIWVEKRDKSLDENVNLTKEEREKLEYEKEVLKDAMRYCEEEIERDKWTR